MPPRPATWATLFAAAAVSVTLSATVPVGVSAQDFTDARDLVAASYENSGGAKWDAVKTMVQSSTMTINAPQGDLTGSAKMTFLFPGYLHVRMLLDIDDDSGMPMGITQVMMPDSGYAQSAQGTQSLPGGQAPDSPNEDADLLAEDGPNLSLEKADLNGNAVYKVTVETEDDTTSNYYDFESLLKVAKEVPTPAGAAWIYYDDYKDVDGLMLPHKITQEAFGGMTQVMTIRSIELNPEIDKAALFGAN
jgi:hypothetical protein